MSSSERRAPDIAPPSTDFKNRATGSKKPVDPTKGKPSKIGDPGPRPPPPKGSKISAETHALGIGAPVTNVKVRPIEWLARQNPHDGMLALKELLQNLILELMKVGYNLSAGGSGENA
ncbi:hypothetical protein Fmac_004925 [Flemingia macrophylla]|uniref:Uncharacterized protein n=1 Tax=Flemingia macrophylla TaxID=520843 RepID=A0ABD1N8X7_9FABA